jgi:hypothetical protein
MSRCTDRSRNLLGLNFSSLRIALAAFALTLIGACDSTHGGIVVDREAVLKGVGGQPNVITRGPDGGFVVAGISGVAWAVGVSAKGDVLWKHTDARDTRINSTQESTYVGAVPLSNGNTLLCGDKYIVTDVGMQNRALVSILDKDGQVVDQRLMLPNGDSKYFSAAFTQCFAWGDGIALIGGGTSQKAGGGSEPTSHPTNWIVKLDKNGAMEWERADSETPGDVAVEVANHNLVFLSGGVGDSDERIVRINQKGDVVARGGTSSSVDYTLLRTFRPAESLYVVAHGRTSGKQELRTIDGNLNVTGKPRSLPSLYIEPGCGYTMTDGSVVLFGSTNIRDAGVIWANRRGRADALRTLTLSGDTSIGQSDAIPLSEHQYVTVRDQISVNAKRAGVVLTWITLK